MRSRAWRQREWGKGINRLSYLSKRVVKVCVGTVRMREGDTENRRKEWAR